MFIRTSIIAAALAIPFAANAQTGGSRTPMPTQAAPAPATPTVGATLYDPQGVEAGTIDSITPQAIVVSTGTAKVAVPPNAVGPGEKGLVVSLTKAQLNAAAEQANAQAQAQVQAQLVAGASVRGSNGNVLGTIKSATDMIVVTTDKGDVSLPRTAFAMGPQGLVAGVTAEQLDAALAGAQPQAATSEAPATETPAQ